MTFLASMERNSLKSRYAYQFGLIHFQRFLSQNYPDYNLETILKPLAENKINPYELLDSFVSYLQTSNGTLTPSSVKLYIDISNEATPYLKQWLDWKVNWWDTVVCLLSHHSEFHKRWYAKPIIYLKRYGFHNEHCKRAIRQ